MNLNLPSRFLLAICLATSSLLAQSAAVSQISGTIRDSGGLVIPGAQVTVTQTSTGLSRSASTGAEGNYTLTSLPVGPYKITVTKDGFNSYIQEGIVLQVGSNPLIDATLKLGSINQQIIVEADASMVETHTSGVGQVVDQERVVDLPLNGRNALQLVFLAGAATTGDAGLEVRLPVQAGSRTVGVSFVREMWETEGLPQPTQLGRVISNDQVYMGYANVGSVEIGGPYGNSGPAKDSASRRAIFVCQPPKAIAEPADAAAS